MLSEVIFIFYLYVKISLIITSNNKGILSVPVYMPEPCPPITCDPQATFDNTTIVEPPGCTRYHRSLCPQCKCSPGWAGPGTLCGPDADSDGWPDKALNCTEMFCQKVS